MAPMTNSTDSHFRSRMRGAALLAAFAAFIGVSWGACSYDPQHSDIQVLVDGLPASALRGVATLTTTNGDNKQYFPRIPPGGSVALAFTAPSAGTYTVTVQLQAFDALD